MPEIGTSGSMSGDGKRSVAEWLKLPRPSSTLPSGDLGIRRDGSHASHLVVEVAALVEKPDTISMEEAAGVGVPFVTAIEGFRRSGMPKAGEHVLVLGANGKVGQAAVQLATWQGAKVIGVVRRDESYEGHAS